MPISADPFGELRISEVRGIPMAYLDDGAGDAIVFQHGNPTSSYLWRNVMPHCRELGRRLVACDLLGMGGSGKLPVSGPDRYTYAEQRDHLFALWDQLRLGDRVVLVLHDWGSALGFDWASRHPERVAGICYMGALVAPFTQAEWSVSERAPLRAICSPEGEALILEQNIFVERYLPGGVLRTLSDAEMDAYRAPFATPGEGRRSTLTWPRQIPVEGQPEDVAAVVTGYGRAMAESAIPKLFVNADPGRLLTGRARTLCRTWPNQTEVTVQGRHYVQEDSPDEIGSAIAAFVRHLDSTPASNDRSGA